jgi:hypothetical protein
MRSCIVAIDTGNRVLYRLADLRIRNVRVTDRLEALYQVAVAEFQVGRDNRGVAVDAHRRRREFLPLGEGLIIKHLSVPAALAIVSRKRISRPDDFQKWILLEFRARYNRSRISLGWRMRHGLTAAVFRPLHIDRPQVKVILHGEVFAPHCRVLDGVVQFDNAIERTLSSCLRSKMFTSSAAIAMVARVASATTSKSMRRDGVADGASVMIASYKNGMGQGGSRFGMSDRSMAARALQTLRFAMHNIPIDRGRDALVAVTARVFGYW